MPPQDYTEIVSSPISTSRESQKLMAYYLTKIMSQEHMRDWSSGRMALTEKQHWEDETFSKLSWRIWEMVPPFIPERAMRYRSLTDEEITCMENQEVSDIYFRTIDMSAIARQNPDLAEDVETFTLASEQCMRYKLALQHFAAELKDIAFFFGCTACRKNTRDPFRKRADEMFSNWLKFRKSIRVFFAWQRYELRKEQHEFIIANVGDLKLYNHFDRRSFYQLLPFHGDFKPPSSVAGVSQQPSNSLGGFPQSLPTPGLVTGDSQQSSNRLGDFPHGADGAGLPNPQFSDPFEFGSSAAVDRNANSFSFGPINGNADVNINEDYFSRGPMNRNTDGAN